MKDKFKYKKIELIMVILLIVNLIMPTSISSANGNVKLFTSSGFEEGLKGWGIWLATTNMKIELDSTNRVEGINSIKLYNNATTTERGTLYQTINADGLIGKTIKLKQNIKSQNFSGNMKIRIKFLTDTNAVIGNLDYKSIYLDENTDWQLKEYAVEVPNNVQIKKIMFEYMYDNAKGSVWIDNINTDITDTIKTTEIFKNSSFEEELSYWTPYISNGALKIQIDNTINKDGNKSIKFNNTTITSSRGSILQQTDVTTAIGKSIKLDQLVKSENFKGNISIQTRFLNSSGQYVSDIDEKRLYMQGSKDWELKQYIIDVPNNKDIVYANITYLYDNGIGSLWIDGIHTEVIDTVITNNVIRNGDFKEDFSYWDTWTASSDLTIQLDDTIKQQGNKTIKLSNLSNNTARGIITQKVDVQNGIGKTLKLKPWIKSENFMGQLQVRVRYTNINGQQVGLEDTKNMLVNSTSDWNFKELFFNIPNDTSIKYAIVEPIYNYSKGTIWLDDISGEFIDSIESDNIFKNGSFEEDISYWNVWKADNNLNLELDTINKIEGLKAIKVSNTSSTKTRGILSQNISITDNTEDKVLEVSQWVKTQNLIGDSIKAEISFKDETGTEVTDAQVYVLGLSSTQDWDNLIYNIFIPSGKDIKKVTVDYIFESITGTLWIDNVFAYETKAVIEKNIVQNGGFESTVNNPISSWYLRDINGNIKYVVDSTNKIEGKNSLKINADIAALDTKVSQIVTVSKELLGKTIEVSEYSKSDTKNVLYKTIRYLDENSKMIGEANIEPISITPNTEWKQNKYTFKIPENDKIKGFEIDYSVRGIKGSFWIDDIRVEPYIAIEEISLTPYLLSLNKAETKELNLSVEPINSTYKNIKIYSSDTKVFTVQDNKITGISKGAAKLIVEQENENKMWEFPVVVDGITSMPIDKIINLEGTQGESITGKINGIDSNYKIGLLSGGKSGYIDIKNDGNFIYYTNNDFEGNDSISVLIQDNNLNIQIVQINLTVKKRILDLSKNNFIITLKENSSITDSINVKYNEALTFSLEKQADNGVFSIDANGNYSYTPKSDFYGYDNVKIMATMKNNEKASISTLVYVAPSVETMVKNLNTQYPRLMANSTDFDNIKILMQADNVAKEWFTVLQRNTDKLLTLPVIPYEKPDGLRMNTTSLEYIKNLSFMYKVTGETKYAERAWLELQNICNYPDWNETQHFLDTASMSIAVATGYDWLNDYLTVTQKELLKKAIITKALEKSIVYYNNNSGFDAMTNNWNIVCNSAMIFSSLAISDTSNYTTTLDIAQKALISIQKSIKDYYKDGSSVEGPAYWSYSTEYLILGMSSLENILKINEPFNKIIDFKSLADFAVYIQGNKSVFNYSDSGAIGLQSYFGLWFAKELNEPKYTEFTKTNYDNTKNLSIFNLLWYNPVLYGKDHITELDKHFNENQITTMRSSFLNDNASFIAFKGGVVGVDHGDLDIGSFVYDSLGVRWALDLGPDNYNLQGYFNDEPLGERWQYYRKRTEGHNTLLIGSASNEEQVIASESKVIESELNGNNPYVILDMTPVYGDKAINVKRKLGLINYRKDLVIEDEFLLKDFQDVVWQMHTDAAIQVLSSGKELILNKDGKILNIKIESDNDIKFEVVDAKPSIASPTFSSENQNLGIKKIIAKSNVKSGKIRVQLTPQGDNNTNKDRIVNGSFEEQLNGWSQWKVTENFDATIDNTVYKDGFNSLKISSNNLSLARGSVNQKIDVSKYYNNTLTLSQWVKCENLNKNFTARFTFFDAIGNTVGAQQSQILLGAGTQDWVLKNINITMPVNTKQVMIEYLYDSAIGNVWIDNLNQVIEKEDINADGIVDIVDLSSVALVYNKYKDNLSWSFRYDVNGDGVVDIYDLVFISRRL